MRISGLSENTSHRNLRRILMLRWVMIGFLSATAVALILLSIPLHKAPLIIAIGSMLLLNLVTWLRLRNPRNIRQHELMAQLLGDIITLTLLFYFTGGYSNPFVWMYLLPLTVAAVALPRLQVWLLAGLAMLCYSLLVFYYVPLSHLHMHDRGASSLDIHLVGMWLGFVLSAGIIAAFVARIGQSLRDADHLLAEAREQALESERMMALGSLAASAAHELGTPLATMAVLAKELQQVSTGDDAVKLKLLSQQISHCKEILSSLAQSAGQARADGQVTDVETFLQSSINRWRDTRPATSLEVNLQGTQPVSRLFADRTLTQALQNLLDNAADASPEKIKLDALWDADALNITIRDFGSGLNHDTAAKIGTPFFTSKPDKGMGLGVYLTRIILERFDGTLTLNNHADGGVVTTVMLPLIRQMK
jgi:two-component system, sensor histidine kinase RegB